MQTLQHVPVHDGSIFTWKGGEGSIEASDFANQREIEARIWADACDVGFKVRSHRTGKEAIFVHSHKVTNDDNEVLFWVYEMHGRPEVTIKVFND